MEEDVVRKDVGEGRRGEVVVGGEVSVGDDENGEGGAIQKIYDEGRGRGEEGGE